MPAGSPSPLDDPHGLLAAGRYRELFERHEAARAAGAWLSPDAELLAATAALRLGDPGRSAPLATAALAGFSGRADLDGVARAENLLGAAAFERGDLDEAHKRFTRAHDTATRLGDRQLLARAANNLASLVVLRGEPDAARPLYREALTVYVHLGDRRGIAEARHNLSLAARRLRQWDEAEIEAAEAVRSAEMVREGGLLALTLTGRAETDVERGDADLARTRARRARELAAEAGDALGVGEAARVEALAAFRLGAFAEAVAGATEARAVARAHAGALLEAEASAVLARALRAEGRADEAETARRDAEDGFRRLGAVGLLREFEADWATG